MFFVALHKCSSGTALQPCFMLTFVSEVFSNTSGSGQQFSNQCYLYWAGKAKD